MMSVVEYEGEFLEDMESYEDQQYCFFEWLGYCAYELEEYESLNNTSNCWISADGKVYPCKYCGHRQALAIINLLKGHKFRSEEEAEEVGWIKMSIGSIHCRKTPVTRKVTDLFLSEWTPQLRIAERTFHSPEMLEFWCTGEIRL